MSFKNIASKELECKKGCGTAKRVDKATTVFVDLGSPAGPATIVVVYGKYKCAKCGCVTTQQIPDAESGRPASKFSRRVRNKFNALVEHEGMSYTQAAECLDEKYGVMMSYDTAKLWFESCTVQTEADDAKEARQGTQREDTEMVRGTS